MKSSQILASILFGSFAAAVPFKRDLLTHTEYEVETVVVYTTVWEDESSAAEATTTAAGYSYEHRASSAAQTTPAAVSTPAYTPSPVASSIYTPAVTSTPAATSAPAPSSAAVVSSAAVSSVVVVSSAPAVETSAAPVAPTTTTEAAYTPAPVSSAAPAATTAAAASTDSTSTGESFASVDLTINPLNGALGACGEPMDADSFYVAIAQPAWGASTYNSQTGAATNKWCGQKIMIEYNGKSVPATIMDMCPGCSGHDLDLSNAAWAAIGMTEYTRVQGSWSMVN